MAGLVLDLSGLATDVRTAAPLEPGDIMRSRRGDLYMIVALPPEENTPGRSSQYLYYFRIDRDGEVIRSGQMIAGAAERDWEKVGHADITISEPEWFV